MIARPHCPHCKERADIGRHGWAECIARRPVDLRALLEINPIFCCVCGSMLPTRASKVGRPRKACPGRCVRVATEIQKYVRHFGRRPAICRVCGEVFASDVACACPVPAP